MINDSELAKLESQVCLVCALIAHYVNYNLRHVSKGTFDCGNSAEREREREREDGRGVKIKT